MLSGYAIKYAEAVWGRLVADKAANLEDSELERILLPCVCGEMVLRVAKELRDNDYLVMGWNEVILKDIDNGER